MKSHKLIVLMLGYALGAVGALPFASLAQTGNEVVQGRLSQIKQQQLTIQAADGKHREFRFDLAKAKCFDFRGDPTTCETLIGIGYADKARITLVGGVIQRVDILELQQ